MGLSLAACNKVQPTALSQEAIQQEGSTTPTQLEPLDNAHGGESEGTSSAVADNSLPPADPDVSSDSDNAESSETSPIASTQEGADEENAPPSRNRRVIATVFEHLQARGELPKDFKVSGPIEIFSKDAGGGYRHTVRFQSGNGSQVHEFDVYETASGEMQPVVDSYLSYLVKS